ncbi:MAG: M48 family metallopeptidase [Burkholderiales bacterium]|nr:M48 family metallopeptidase [Burkholderiales bacterium]
MYPFTAAFLAALALATAGHLWLSLRHMRHVRAHRGRVPDQFAPRLNLEAHQRAADYTIARTRLTMIETLAGAGFALVLTVAGGLQWLSGAWSRVFEFAGYAHGIALIAGVVSIAGAIDVPFAAWRTFVIEARFGFNRTSAHLFAADLAKQAALGFALGIPLVFCVLWLMAWMGKLWWLYVWLTWMGFNLLVVAIYPSFIAPLFNRFAPLEDEAVRGRIESLLDRCGFRSQGLFVMDSSRRSSHGNAYFTGFGRTKRIVLFDTLLARLAPREIEAVLAHELGHFSRRHVWKRMALMFAAALAMLWLLGQLMQTGWFYAGLGVSTPSTAAALVLFFVALPQFGFLLEPLATLYSRRQEFEADAYAAAHAPAEDLIEALVKLYRDNAATLTPDPVHSAFYDSHPPAMQRIARLQAVRTP